MKTQTNKQLVTCPGYGTTVSTLNFKFRLPLWLPGLLTALVVCLAGQSTCLAGQNTEQLTVNVIGSGIVASDNMPAARRQAVADGLEEAVCRALDEVLPYETTVDKFQLISQFVLSKTESFILGYKVLTEAVQDRHYRVAVQATVSLSRIRNSLDKLGLMLGNTPYPRVLVLVSEQQLDDQQPRSWWPGCSDHTVVSGDIIARFLAANGFVIIKAGDERLQSLPAGLTADQATAVGRELRADVVVLGNARVLKAPDTTGGSIMSFNASCRLKALKVGNATAFADTEQTGVAVYTEAVEGCRRALQTAAKQAAEDLAAQIEAYWKKQTPSSEAIKILVSGTGGQIANFVRFRGALASVSGVDAVRLIQIMPDKAELAVDYQGNARSLAEALLAKQFSTFGINIYEIGNNEIKLNMVAR